jgi:hypothetical protein
MFNSAISRAPTDRSKRGTLKRQLKAIDGRHKNINLGNAYRLHANDESRVGNFIHYQLGNFSR